MHCFVDRFCYFVEFSSFCRILCLVVRLCITVPKFFEYKNTRSLSFAIVTRINNFFTLAPIHLFYTIRFHLRTDVASLSHAFTEGPLIETSDKFAQNRNACFCAVYIEIVRRKKKA